MINKFMTFPFEVKKVSEDDNHGYIEGFASTFGNIDQGGDVVAEGAFTKTIQENGGSFPVLLDHNPCKPAGYQKVTEESRGLSVKCEFRLYDPEVKQRYELAKLSLAYKKPMGFSIGYGTVKEDYETITPDGGKAVRVRHLKELKLWETSLVVFPMNTEAFVTAAKTWALMGAEKIDPEILMDRILNFGYSKSELLTALEKRAARNDDEPGYDAHSAIQDLKEIENLFGSRH